MATHFSMLPWRIPMHRGTWLATVHRVAKSWTTLSDLAQHSGNSQVALVVKNLPSSAGDRGHVDSIPWSGRSPGGGHGNPFQCSCLENPMDRGAWWAVVQRVAKESNRS